MAGLSLRGLLGGAASGAGLGSAIPGIGTLAGAIGGGVLGLFGGKDEPRGPLDFSKAPYLFGMPNEDYRIPDESRGLMNDTHFSKFFTKNPEERFFQGPPAPKPAGPSAGGSGGGGFAFGGGRGLVAPSYNFNQSPWDITEPERQARLIQALGELQAERSGYEDDFFATSARGGIDSRSGMAQQYLTNLLQGSLGQENDIRGEAFLSENQEWQRHDDFIAQLFANLEAQKMGAQSAYNNASLQAALQPFEQQKILSDIINAVTFDAERRRETTVPKYG